MLHDFEIVRGDTLSFGFELEGISEVDSAFFSCKKNKFDTAYVFQKALYNGIDYVGDNKYRVRVAPEDTANLEVGRYYYDLQIGKNGDIFTIFEGELVLDQGITED